MEYQQIDEFNYPQKHTLFLHSFFRIPEHFFEDIVEALKSKTLRGDSTHVFLPTRRITISANSQDHVMVRYGETEFDDSLTMHIYGWREVEN